MRYANRACKFIPEPGTGMTIITGPYWDDPTRGRTVEVKTEDLEKYRTGAVNYVQDAFPYLSADDREFLISGISPAKWDEMFAEDD